MVPDSVLGVSHITFIDYASHSPFWSGELYISLPSLLATLLVKYNINSDNTFNAIMLLLVSFYLKSLKLYVVLLVNK